MKGPLVGGGVAEVEGKEFLVFNLTGSLIEAALLQAIRTVKQPAVLGHRCDQQSFGGVLRFLLFHEGFEQGVVFSLILAGQDAEGVGVVVEAVRGAILRDGGFPKGCNRPRTVLRILAIRVNLFFC